MKMVKNIAIVAFATSFMFAGIGFHMANNYADLDGAQTVGTSYGATFDLNDQTGVGYDSALGMLMYFEAPLGVTLRLGWSETNSTSSVGMGFTWWLGGDGLKTSIGTAYDMVAANDGSTNDANLSVVVGFGF